MPPKKSTDAAAEKRCTTCNETGHAWKKCENPCQLCAGVHHHLPCPVFLDQYPNFEPRSARDDAVTALEKRNEAGARENTARDLDITTWETVSSLMVTQWVDPLGPFPYHRAQPERVENAPAAASAGGNPPPDKAPGALELLSGVMIDGAQRVRSFFDFVPGYGDMSSSRRQKCRQRLDLQASGKVAMPADSELRIAFDRWNCWPAHLRRDWFPDA